MSRINDSNTKLSSEETTELLSSLQERFAAHMERHEDVTWDTVLSRLETNSKALKRLYAMEHTEGEPDVVGRDDSTNELIFVDCSKESPKGRRKVCYDDAALKGRKKFPPETSAEAMAKEMGIRLLSETQYRKLQELGEFDTKTSSWIETPDDIRNLGGALYCDRRYDTVFVYHNGADSYYSSRGFRGYLRV